MSEANKAIATKVIQALGAGDVDTMKTLVTTDLVITARGHSKVSGSRDYQTIMASISQFPKITKSGIVFKILNLTAEEDRVACETEGYSTLLNGRDYNNHYHYLMFFRDGKVCKMHEYLDTNLADEMLGPYLTPGSP